MATRFINLKDTPKTYAGAEDYVLVVSGNEVVFQPQSGPSTVGATTFDELVDVDPYPSTPAPANISKYLTSDGTKMVYKDYYDGTTWDDLQNTPASKPSSESYVKLSNGQVVYDTSEPNEFFKFTWLTDTPDVIPPEQYIRVKSDETGLEFYQKPESAGETFVGLEDTPNSIDTANQYVHVINDQLVFHDDDFTTFLDLLDTPNTYDGIGANDMVVVNPEENGLTFLQTETTQDSVCYLKYSGVNQNTPITTTCDQFSTVDWSLIGFLPVQIDSNCFQVLPSPRVSVEYTGFQTRTFAIDWTLTFQATNTNGFEWLVQCDKNPVVAGVPSNEVAWLGREGNYEIYTASGSTILTFNPRTGDSADTLSLYIGLVNKLGQTPICYKGSARPRAFSITAQELY